MTTRDEILAVLPNLEFRSGDGTFSVEDVVGALRRRGSQYSERTIRTQVTSRMCVDRGQPHHAVVDDDLERVERGRCRRRQGPSNAP